MKKAGIQISGQTLTGLLAAIVIIGLIILVFIVPGVGFFSQQAFNTKMEKNLENLKETITQANETGSEIIFDAQDLALIIFNKNQICSNLILPENCNGKNCICACKLGKLGILHEEGCLMGKCDIYEESLKGNNCIVLKNELNNVIVSKKNSEITINKK